MKQLDANYSDLIGASPLLYEALKAMLDAFYEDPLENDTGAAVEKAYAAIALAPEKRMKHLYGDYPHAWGRIKSIDQTPAEYACSVERTRALTTAPHGTSGWLLLRQLQPL